jgi:hypothetical protein
MKSWLARVHRVLPGADDHDSQPLSFRSTIGSAWRTIASPIDPVSRTVASRGPATSSGSWDSSA